MDGEKWPNGIMIKVGNKIDKVKGNGGDGKRLDWPTWNHGGWWGETKRVFPCINMSSRVSSEDAVKDFYKTILNQMKTKQSHTLVPVTIPETSCEWLYTMKRNTCKQEVASQSYEPTQKLTQVYSKYRIYLCIPIIILKFSLVSTSIISHYPYYQLKENWCKKLQPLLP